MSKGLELLTLPVQVPYGMHIRRAAELAQDLANKTGCMVRFEFGRIECRVHPEGTPGKLLENYYHALNAEILFAENW